MTWFKVRYRLVGHHYHCVLFAARNANSGYQMLGTFTCNQQELKDLKEKFHVMFEPREDEP